MPNTQPASRPRGPYAKSRAVQADILDQAVSVFTKRGFHGTSMRDIAAAAGLTPPGLTHHFGDKAELLMAVLARRDAASAERLNTADDQTTAEKLRDVAKNNRDDPDSARLFTTLAAEAADAGHPAHQWFQDRYRHARALVVTAVRTGQERDELRQDVAPEAVADLIIAVLDGLQLQSQLDSGVDTDPALEALLTLLHPGLDRPAD
ncbi:TetR/AcrR family transcriptional regulator [Nocardioides scoriae]|uniref:TetR/AcrR family transcriptional regulator n=1 Tax=Nocardioides scoriae TaxID=642780 RepID=UPI00155FDDB6|nr:TetR/AcrR family transcriptional regulator [Nocardioides scoriae]